MPWVSGTRLELLWFSTCSRFWRPPSSGGIEPARSFLCRYLAALGGALFDTPSRIILCLRIALVQKTR